MNKSKINIRNTKERMKYKPIWIGGIIGLALSIILIINQKLYLIKWFYQPLFKLNTFITGCSQECFFMYLLFPIIFTFLFILIGLLIAFIINKIKSVRIK